MVLFCIVFVKENYQGYNTYFFLNPFYIILLHISSYKKKVQIKRRQNNENMHEEKNQRKEKLSSDENE